MATYSKNWSSQTWIEGGAAAWTTLSGVTEEFSSSVDLVTSGLEGVHLMVEVNFDATPTDDVDVSIYGSLDGTNWDDVAMFTQRIDNGTDPSQLSFVITDVAYFRVGFVQTGSTDCHDVRASYRSWNYTDA